MILLIGNVFGVVIFYWVLLPHWDHFEKQYKVAWFFAIAPIHLVLSGLIVYGITFLIFCIVGLIMRKRGKKRQEEYLNICANYENFIYNKEFEIKKIVRFLDYNFFKEKLNERELVILKTDFSQVYKINDDEVCTICQDNLYDSLVTKLPTCNHKYHFDC